LGFSPWGADANAFTLSEPPHTAAECFANEYVNQRGLGADYDLFMPTVGSHCHGTNHQDIAWVERVVFLGDSITVGTPPTLSALYYRSQLSDALATRFGLSYGGLEWLWKQVNPFDGVSIIREAGDFASCAHWGDGNADLLRDSTQLERCFPPDKRHLRTLVVMTSGGNDLAKLTRNAIDGAPVDDLWMQIMEIVQLKSEVIHWLVGDPAKFPNGVFVIFANIYEFSDGTGDVQSCDVSDLAGFDEPLPVPEQLVEMLVWANEQYLRIAVESGTDMIFMAEAFCGHGFNHDDPTSPCYRGPETDRWFDLTCIHPNPTGHTELANMFLSVVDE
jgi:hypothetical protein